MRCWNDAFEQPGASEVERSPTVHVTYFTDPLCSWSWAFEPVWQEVRRIYAPDLMWRYSLAGMIRDWGSYADPLNDIAGPAQMGPQWMHVGQLTGAPFDVRIWQDDPPRSSYPACVAVKAAEQQGCAVGDAYLHRMRRAVMVESRNVARREVQLELAREMDSAGAVALDVARFEAALDNGSAVDAFRADLGEAQMHGIGRFPTLVVRGAHGPGLAVVGYRPLDVLREVVESVVGAGATRPRE